MLTSLLQLHLKKIKYIAQRQKGISKANGKNIRTEKIIHIAICIHMHSHRLTDNSEKGYEWLKIKTYNLKCKMELCAAKEKQCAVSSSKINADEWSITNGLEITKV